ncbi:hypothetical protein HB834_00240 [Listeria booriae]|uniref:hypothetical protein n=1 Tax=Listeria booriae TaxID=1552123 RepID=UPI00164D0C5B|nr:hypothetical protein [Listeria booriae]MBC6150075.1 hypothetical protein [Listeria booriae]
MTLTTDFSAINRRPYYCDNQFIEVEHFSKYKDGAFSFTGWDMCHIDKLLEDVQKVRRWGKNVHIYFNKTKTPWGADEQEKIVIESELYEALRGLGVLA